MERLQLEVRVSKSPELAARVIEQATHWLSSGGRAAAERTYRDAVLAGVLHSSSWSNLAALGVGLGDPAGARAHAQRALQLDRGNVDAWVNFGVASWRTQQRRDAAQAMQQALALAPGLSAAALNYSSMLQAVDRLAQAREVLALAALANPRAWRLHQAAAEAARLQGDAEATRRHALTALALLRPTLQLDTNTGDTPAATAPAETDNKDVLGALLAVHNALTAGGQDFHLIGGTLLAIWRDGRLFPHDKDVDLGLPFDTDREALAAILSDGFTPMRTPGDAHAAESRAWVMGYIHDASKVGVDLMFVQPRGEHLRFELGWPDQLACEVPVYTLQTLHWQGHDWQVPSPPERYLDAIYGPDWHGGVMIRGYDRRYFDTQISNPSRTADSLPRAINLVLLRLLHALQQRQWAKAYALCVQILAREDLAEVAAVRARVRKHAQLAAHG